MKPGLTKVSGNKVPKRNGISNAFGSMGTEVPTVITLALGVGGGGAVNVN